MPWIVQNSILRNISKYPRILVEPDCIFSSLYWTPNHALWSLWVLQAYIFWETGVKNNPASFYPPIFDNIEWMEMQNGLPISGLPWVDSPPHRDRLLETMRIMDASKISREPLRWHTHKQTEASIWVQPILKRGAGSLRRYLINKNGNRGSIFPFRVGVVTLFTD